MNITVLLGGTSAERDVSIASGLRIGGALRSRGHTITLLDPAVGVIDAEEERRLLAGGVKRRPPELDALDALSRGGALATLATRAEVLEADVVFLALHGGQGEDGTIQALLDLAGVRYTGSGHLASALAMDKDLSKHLFRAAGVGTADWVMARREKREERGERRPSSLLSPLSSLASDPPSLEEVVAYLGLPLIVKPSKQGSTVGLTLVKARAELEGAIDEAFRFDDEVMLERFVPGRELTVGILGGEALPVGEIIPKHEIYDYECKYTSGMATEVFPAELNDDQTRRVQDQARRAFHALKLGGCARIDFRMTPEGELFCLEANTLPGMTELSLIPQAAAAAGLSFPELCERIARLALAERGGERREGEGEGEGGSREGAHAGAGGASAGGASAGVASTQGEGVR